MTKPEIISLCSGYSGGKKIKGSYDYTITKDDDRYYLRAIMNSGNNEIEKKLSKDKFEILVGLFDSVDFASLKNIDKSNGERALDAASFNSIAQFSDGNICSISSKAAASEALLEAVKVYEASVRKMIEKRTSFNNITHTSE